MGLNGWTPLTPLHENRPRFLVCGWCGYLLHVSYLLWDEYEGKVDQAFRGDSDRVQAEKDRVQAARDRRAAKNTRGAG